MKREKRQTKKERKAAERTGAPALGPRAAAQGHQHQHAHIHCIACGKHLDTEMFGESADFIRCEHGSDFAHCTGCYEKAKELVTEHDRTNQPVKKAAAWH